MKEPSHTDVDQSRTARNVKLLSNPTVRGGHLEPALDTCE